MVNDPSVFEPFKFCYSYLRTIFDPVSASQRMLVSFPGDKKQALLLRESILQHSCPNITTISLSDSYSAQEKRDLKHFKPEFLLLSICEFCTRKT